MNHTTHDGAPDHVVRAQAYGVDVHDTKTLDDITAIRTRIADNGGRQVDWKHPELARILRFRLIGWSRHVRVWDVSYCYGEMADGRAVRVQLPFHQLKSPSHDGWKAALVEQAKADGVNAKHLGFFDPDVCSTVDG